jgi:predicted naringenin-chalcone synthase
MASPPHATTRPAVLALGTAVPPYQIDQAALGHWMADVLSDQPKLGRWLDQLYAKSGVETRYSCLPEAENPTAASPFSPHHTREVAPTTAARMAIYEREAVQVGVAAAQDALRDYAEAVGCDEREAGARITHLVAVSCTGFFAPGIDQAIARHLGLRPTVERTIVGFMGCAAAFNALRLAASAVKADPEARVLVVCVELCSLHIQPGANRTDLVVASLFADGAGACIVGAAGDDLHDQFVVEQLYTALEPDSTGDMVWQIGDYGFGLELSALIPRRLEAAAPAALAHLVHDPDTLDFWAIHPGGRAIVDRLEAVFGLRPEQIAPSRDVLRRYGNMSSPTILFVLRAWREQFRAAQLTEAAQGVAMAFGPGLVIEMAKLQYVPAGAEAIAGEETTVALVA